MGANRRDAVCAISRMTSDTALTPTTFYELYGRGKIVYEANDARRDLNAKGLGIVDLRQLRDDGEHWDLSKGGKSAYESIHGTKPNPRTIDFCLRAHPILCSQKTESNTR